MLSSSRQLDAGYAAVSEFHITPSPWLMLAQQAVEQAPTKAMG